MRRSQWRREQGHGRRHALQVPLELLRRPHQLRRLLKGPERGAVALDGVVGEVHVPVVVAVASLAALAVWGRAEAQVRLSKGEHAQRVDVGDQDPLPNVKLAAVDEEGPRDVPLHHHAVPAALRVLAQQVPRRSNGVLAAAAHVDACGRGRKGAGQLARSTLPGAGAARTLATSAKARLHDPARGRERGCCLGKGAVRRRARRVQRGQGAAHALDQRRQFLSIAVAACRREARNGLAGGGCGCGQNMNGGVTL